MSVTDDNTLFVCCLLNLKSLAGGKRSIGRSASPSAWPCALRLATNLWYTWCCRESSAPGYTPWRAISLPNITCLFPDKRLTRITARWTGLLTMLGTTMSITTSRASQVVGYRSWRRLPRSFTIIYHATILGLRYSWILLTIPTWRYILGWSESATNWRVIRQRSRVSMHFIMYGFYCALLSPFCIFVSCLLMLVSSFFSSFFALSVFLKFSFCFSISLISLTFRDDIWRS